MTSTMKPSQTDTAEFKSEFEPPTRDRMLASQAINLLSKCDSLRSRLVNIQVEYNQFSLEVTGNLPSYYLKQQVQEALRPLGTTVNNRVQVE